MTSVIPVPTLSAKGLVYGIVEKTDILMAHFFASDANQDFLYKDKIANLAILLQQAGNDIPKLKENLRISLQQYLGRYFEVVVVNVDDDIATNPSNRIELKISALVTQSGERYDLSTLLSLVNGKFEKITKLNNTGSVN